MRLKTTLNTHSLTVSDSKGNAVENLVGSNYLISVMVESEDNWAIIQKYEVTLLRSKKRDLDAGAQM